MGYMRLAVGYYLFNSHLNSPLRLRFKQGTDVILAMDTCLTVNPQPLTGGKINKQTADMRVLHNITQAHKGSVTIKVRKSKMSAVNYLNQSRPAAFK